MNNKKVIFLSILVSIIGMLITTGTFAFFNWQSNNKGLSFNVASNLKNYIEYDNGDSTFIGDFQVSNSFTDGIHSTISIKKKQEAASISMVATINMDINAIGPNMAKSSALKWVVTSGNSSSVGPILSQGNFIGSKSGDTLMLLPNIEVTTSVKEYTIWIWLDINEHPSDALSGETLDTAVWTQIEQLAGKEEIYEITKINANYQRISATVINNKNVITKYAIMATTDTPSSWTNIDTNLQNNIYNLEYNTSATGTYYVWFMDSVGIMTSSSISVTNIDTTAPSCIFGEFSVTPIKNNETSQITLTCTDNESTIENHTITQDNLVTSSSVVTITNVRKEQVTNGYKYTITVTGTENDGSATLTLPANIIRNSMHLGNTITTSTASVTVRNIIDLSSASITLNPTSFTYDGTAKEPTITVIVDGDTLTRNTDYSASFANNINVGTATVTITGINDYEGSASATFTINKKSLIPSISSCSNKVYDGSTDVTCTIGLATPNIGDTITASGTCTFDDKNAANAKTVTCTGITLGGSQTGNYTLSTASVSKTSAASITKKGLSIAAYSTEWVDGNSTYTQTNYATGVGTEKITLTYTPNMNYPGTYTYATTTGSGKYLLSLSDMTNYSISSANTFSLTDSIPPTASISGGDAGKATILPVTITCTDAVGVNGWYWGTTAASTGTTFTAITSATSWTGTANATAATTYYLGCKDIGGNVTNASVVIRSYAVSNMLLNLNGTKGTYTTGNYTRSGNILTYYIKNGTSLAATSICTQPTGGTLVGYKSGEPSTTNASPLTATGTATTITANSVFGCWYNRNEYTVTINAGANGKVTAQAVSQGTSAVANDGASATLTVRYGDTVKGTASANTGYAFASWASGYLSGSTNPATGAAVTAAKTITGTFNAVKQSLQQYDANGGGSSQTSNFLSTTIKRNKIESVNFANSISGHTVNGTDCWDVGEIKNGTTLAWATDSNSNGRYEITIGSTGIVDANQNSSRLFENLKNTTSIGQINNFNTSKVTNMFRMFYNAINLTSLDVSNFNTTNVTSMGGMFESVSKLPTLDVSNWNTSNVTNMYRMFSGTKNLTSLDVSNFNTSKVTDMSQMFELMSNITSLDVSNFNTSNVTNMLRMFYSSEKLTSLDISRWNTSNVTSMGSMFESMRNLTSLNISNFNTSKVTNMSSMFCNVRKITSLDVSNFNTTNVTNMYFMFANMSNITSLNTSRWNTSNVTSMGGMFESVSNLTSLNLSNWNTSKVTNMSRMFYSAKNLTSLNVSNFNTSNVTDMSMMFAFISNVTSLDVGNWNTSKVTNMSWMFASTLSNLTSLNVNNWNTSNVINMNNMFYSLGKLTSLNVSNFNTSNVTDMSRMFQSMNNLTSLNVSKFNTSKVTNMQYMFYSVSKLTSLNISNWNTSNVTDMSLMFDLMSNITSLDVSNWNTAKVTAMNSMFEKMGNLISLNISSFNTSNVINMSRMFNNLNKIKTIYVGTGWSTTNVTNSVNMFTGTINLRGGAGTTYNSSYIDGTYARIDGGTSSPGYFTAAGTKGASTNSLSPKSLSKASVNTSNISNTIDECNSNCATSCLESSNGYVCPTYSCDNGVLSGTNCYDLK